MFFLITSKNFKLQLHSTPVRLKYQWMFWHCAIIYTQRPLCIVVNKPQSASLCSVGVVKSS